MLRHTCKDQYHCGADQWTDPQGSLTYSQKWLWSRGRKPLSWCAANETHLASDPTLISSLVFILHISRPLTFLLPQNNTSSLCHCTTPLYSRILISFSCGQQERQLGKVYFFSKKTLAEGNQRLTIFIKAMEWSQEAFTDRDGALLNTDTRENCEQRTRRMWNVSESLGSCRHRSESLWNVSESSKVAQTLWKWELFCANSGVAAEVTFLISAWLNAQQHLTAETRWRPVKLLH